MKRPNLSIRFLQRAVHLIIALGTASFLDVSAAADFTDANWTSMGGINGVNDTVFAAIAHSQGNLYIGGGFTEAGGIPASYIAKWNGSSWSALGSGMGGGPPGYGGTTVYSVAVSGTYVYAGGSFTTAGGGADNYVAR